MSRVSDFARPVLVGLALLLVTTACAPTGAPGPDAGGPPPGDQADAARAFEQQAVQVAAAWRTALAGTGAAATVWRQGFVPLQGGTVTPPAGDDPAGHALRAGWFTLDTTLPTGTPKPTRLAFPDGGALVVPLVSAGAAYAELDRGDAACPGPPTAPPAGAGPDTATSGPAEQPCESLRVTGAELGSVPLRTSRGEVAAPAWLFRVAGLAEPVARVAVAPEAVAEPLSVDLPAAPHTPGLVTAQDLRGVDGARLDYTLGVGACDSAITPLVYETAEVIVVGGSVTTTGGVCIDLLKIEPVSVTLAAPVAARPVLDVGGGQPLRLTPTGA